LGSHGKAYDNIELLNPEMLEKSVLCTNLVLIVE
jgi:hypothetical protein